MTGPQRVVVVGGGIAGLTAALDLADAGASVTVLESSDRVGGKLRSGEVGGLPVDLGAESVLARRPEAIALMDRLGLHYEPVRSSSAALWSHGALRALPRTVLGIPVDLDAAVDAGVLEHRPDPVEVPLPDHDLSVAEYVGERVGREVVDRLVEPLLGGVYAGHADRLSLRAAAPQLAALGPDPAAVAARTASAGPVDGPVFVAPTGGVGTLPDALVATEAFEVRTGTIVRAIERVGQTWRLTTGATNALEVVEADAVVLATPAPATARLLAAAAPRAAFALAGVDYASMAIVTFVLDGAHVDVGGSGFLVPPVEGTFIKAATFSTAKWTWSREAAQGRTVVRTSVGRAGEATLLHDDDATLAERAGADLARIAGDLGEVTDVHVQRWGGALPQYEVGHLDLIREVEDDIAAVGGLEVCGAAYQGIGIPAVIASAHAAAARLLDSGTTKE